MKKNVGNSDRIIRFIIGAALAVVLLTGTVAIATTLGIILTVVMVIMLFTSLTSWCAVYQVTGLSTCKVSPE